MSVDGLVERHREVTEGDIAEHEGDAEHEA